MSTQISPESSQSLLRAFSCQSEDAALQTLQDIYRHRETIYLFLNGQPHPFATQLLEMNLAMRQLVFDRPNHPAFDKASGADVPYIAVAFPHKVKVQFESTGLSATEHISNALVSNCPTQLYRFQRRSYYRVSRPGLLNGMMSLEIPSLETKVRIVDMSIAGIGLEVHAPPSQFKVGQVIDEAHLNIHDSKVPLLLELTVRNIKPLNDRYDRVQLGCEMTSPMSASEHRLQRLLMKMEARF